MNKDYKKFDIFRAKKEYFDWGTISWLDDSETTEQSGMLIAHVTFLPNKVQGKHTHTGDEQVLYTISGQGEHWLNGKYYPLVPGTIYHIPTFVEHNIVNTSEVPLEMIIVYTINYNQIDSLLPKIDFIETYSEKKLIDLVDFETLDNMIKGLSDATGFSIIVQDEHGKILTKSMNRPKFCELYSDIGHHCHLKISKSLRQRSPDEHDIQNCCFDLVKINSPIYFNERLIGNIICGPVIINEYTKESIDDLTASELSGIKNLVYEYMNVERVTKGHLYGITKLLKRISSFIVDTGSKRIITKEFRDKSIEILKEKNKRVKLEKSLVETQMKVIQAQISPHFLFNTLSVIGQLAYMNGAKEAADTTFALSSLLRTSLTKANEYVSVSDEIKYIEDYVFIQNKRFSNSLNLIIELNEEVKKQFIPFLMLQILVENSIVHGFEKLEKTGTLTIEGSIGIKYIYFKINDNGIGIEDIAITNINNNECTSKGTGLGLQSLIQRLEYYYGQDYSFQIHKNRFDGTEVIIKLPLSDRMGTKT